MRELKELNIKRDLGRKGGGGEMKRLSEILEQCNPQFPVKGVNGYGGEMDGTKVVFVGVLWVKSRKEAEKIELGDDIHIHWARYSARKGWEVSLAHWSNCDENECFVRHVEGKKLMWTA